ncbi:MAG: hypothetical protein GY950_21955 [bacterium]|nr:hypothetical protein [bacterium]
MSDKIATYTFLPWLRQGIASQIERKDTLGLVEPPVPAERAEVSVSLRVNERPPLTKNVQLVGPGDILGINPRAIVKTEPRNWITDFEPNYLPFIEFYDEDFPWRYTPAVAVHTDENDKKSRLRPWIFLIVLTEDEFKPHQPLNGTLPFIEILDGSDVFPEAGQTWAWAHVHVNKDITNDSANLPSQAVTELESLLKQNPDEACSRLICPRKLQPNTAYFAFVVPAFETGRLAGLGLDTKEIDGLESSWAKDHDEYPVYFQWYFRTGERGDFEYLVNLLEPRPVEDSVGIRDMDMQQPDYEVTGLTDPTVMGLEGALKKPGLKSSPESWPPDPVPEFLDELQQKVNLQEEVMENDGEEDPVVSPPLYGRWHAQVKKMDFEASGWVNELNKDPRNRVPSGFGTKVIQTHQEKYMQKAWQQLGDVLKANQKIRQVQLAISAGFQIYKKHLLPMTADQLIAVTQAVHSRVMGSPTTIFQQVKESNLPLAAAHPAFRKITRPRGVIAKKALPETKSKPADILVQLNEGKITAAPPKKAPGNQVSLNKAAEQLLPAWMPGWLRDLLRNPSFRWILLGLTGLLVLLGVFFGFGPFIAFPLAALVGVYVFAVSFRSRAEAAVAFREENLTTGAVENIPARPDFKISEPGSVPPSGGGSGTPGTDSDEAANIRLALTEMHAILEADIPKSKPKPKPTLDFAHTALTLTQALNPVTVLPKRMRTIVAIPSTLKYFRPVETIVPILAHPVFSDPMYKPLRDISSELLMPNLNLIPNNTISLLETNRRFIESYMVGVNHEMGRELFWREYLTDQQGSYFRQFWDVGDFVNRAHKTPQQLEEELRDITPIHTWDKDSELGSPTHENRDLPSGSENDARVVLVIRGDILKKYPTAVIFAQKAKWDKDKQNRDVRVLDDSNVQDPIFKAEIEPDIKFLGFNLTVSQVKGSKNIEEDPGWFFVIQERPGEPRFGLDVKDTPGTATEWNDLAWVHLNNFETLNYIDLEAGINADIPGSKIEWGSNAADMAYIFYQVPVMVAFHAGDMLE